MTDQELMDMAKKAAEYAYVPYSKFPVGAALDINPDANCAADRVDGAVKITVGQGWWPLGTEKSEWAGTLAEPSPYSIAAGGSVVRAFAAYGWGWGGTWQSSRDFMHFSVRTDGG